VFFEHLSTNVNDAEKREINPVALGQLIVGDTPDHRSPLLSPRAV
jgi:hypothetical protein